MKLGPTDIVALHALLIISHLESAAELASDSADLSDFDRQINYLITELEDMIAGSPLGKALQEII